MAQNISLLGAEYSAVPSVLLPKTGGGTASFTDVTDTTAAAADVAVGKYFYTAAGVRTQGTNSGGGGGGSVIITDTTDAAGGTIREITATDAITLTTLNATSNQTYTAPSGTAYNEVVVNVGGGGGGGSYSLGTFTVSAANSTAQSYCGYISMEAKPTTSSAVPTYVVAPIKATSSHTARWILEDDGYMYVTFLGSSDSRTPSVTATTGTAQVLYTGSAGTAWNGMSLFCTPVIYKVSNGATLSLNYVNNS